MKSSLSHLLMLSTSLLCLSSLAADTDSDQMPMEKKTPQEECKKANNPHRFEIKHIEAKGIGYKQGYTSLDAFFTGLVGSYVPFLDLRAHVFNNGKWAANAGIGARYIFDPCQWMVGGNVYYDYRRADHDANFNQIGAGLEAFYDHFEARLNGYLPVGSKRKRTKTHFDYVDFKRFSGNYILQNEYYTNTYQGAMKGFNAEVGAHLCGNRMQYDVYLGVGPYYYNLSEEKQSWGAKARLKAEVTKYLFFEISDSYDWIFHNRFQGTVNVSIPFGRRYCYPNKKQQTCHNVMDWQAVLPVERQEIIVATKFKKKQTIDPVAIDPTTGQPFYVVFVDNHNTTTGVGTFENPFQNLSSASVVSNSFPGNTIYVFAGDGTTAHMSSGNNVLQANQRFLGSGKAHQYQTTKGLLTIPAQTPITPQITGAGNNVIVLANNNEVSGFNVTVPSTFAGVQSAAITGANINFNTFTGGAFAVELGGSPTPLVTGTIIVDNNVANQQSAATAAGYQFFTSNVNLIFTNNLGQNTNGTTTRGFFVSLSPSSTATVLAENNTFNSIFGTVAIGMQVLNAGPGGGTVTVRNNSINAALQGLSLNTVSPISTAFIVEGNDVINTPSGGLSSFVATTGGAGAGCVRFNHNTGVPTGIVTPFTINGAGAPNLIYEPFINNYPNPITAGNAMQGTACQCAPCP